MKGVLDAKPNSGYDDDLTRRYHFPRQYLRVASGCIGDWIVFREPQRNGGSRAYVAAARMERIEADPSRPGFSYAIISGYLPFDRPVPFSADGRYAEAPLREIGDPSRVGAYLQGKSVRPLSEEDFSTITLKGLSETLDPANALKLGLDGASLDASTQRLIQAPDYEMARRVVEMLVNHKIRDASFRRQVCGAYDNRCAVTGLRIVNGGGRAEVQAAHIWPVAAGGPDTVRNGIALSATAHWLFDRHLISVTDDYGLLVSHNRVPAVLRSLFQRQLSRIHLPANPPLWPDPANLRRHREAFAPV